MHHCTVSRDEISVSSSDARAKAVWGPKRILACCRHRGRPFGLALERRCAAAAIGVKARKSGRASPNAFVKGDKMDAEVARRSGSLHWSRDRGRDRRRSKTAPTCRSTFQRYSHNGKLERHPRLRARSGAGLAARSAGRTRQHAPRALSTARRASTTRSRRVAVNANAVDTGNGINNPNLYSYTGAGVTVAFIDSGITGVLSIPTLADSRAARRSSTSSTATITRYDDNGHGTHVAGIIAGTGKLVGEEVRGHRAGRVARVAEGADQNGEGTIGNIIKALDWVYKNGKTYGIRVVNLSVGAAVTESYYTDPLTLAAKRWSTAASPSSPRPATTAQNALGQPQWGGVASPGNAPWVLTVCAFSTNGTLRRRGRQGRATSARRVRPQSTSRAKPDLVRAGRRHRLDRGAGQHAVSDRPARDAVVAASGHGADAVSVRAVREPDRHEHGGAVRQRRGRADAAGEPEPDAEPDQGDPRVHRDLEAGRQRAAPGRRLHERRRTPSRSRALYATRSRATTTIRRSRRPGPGTSSGATTC